MPECDTLTERARIREIITLALKQASRAGESHEMAARITLTALAVEGFDVVRRDAKSECEEGRDAGR